MYLESRLLYNSYFVWLSAFTRDWWNWNECFQSKYGNKYYFIPLGGNKWRFPKHYHSFHILHFSPWPICVSFSILTLVAGILDLLTAEVSYGYNLFLGVLEVVVCLWCWWKDVVEESLTEHTKRIKYGIAVGMVLFIISEIMFFFSFFWAFFHVSLAPSIELGCVWPPKGLEHLVISPFGAPLLNTVILLSSGVTVTCAHYAFMLYCYQQRKFSNFLTALGFLSVLKSIRYVYSLYIVCGLAWWRFKSRYFSKLMTLFMETHFRQVKHHFFYKILVGTLFNSNFYNCFQYFVYTILLALFFTVSQIIEYVESAVTISDGVYGSTFFVMTGFHGFHVLVGTIFLIVCFFRILSNRYSFVHFIGLECAIWYWHFVDVVWLFLFIFVYYWGNAFVPILNVEMFDFRVSADFATIYQCDFQDSASVLMESIVDLHNYIMFYLWVILGMVTWMLFSFSVLNFNSSLWSYFKLIKFLFLDVKNAEKYYRRSYYVWRAERKRYRAEIQNICARLSYRWCLLKYKVLLRLKRIAPKRRRRKHFYVYVYKDGKKKISKRLSHMVYFPPRIPSGIPRKPKNSTISKTSKVIRSF